MKLNDNQVKKISSNAQDFIKNDLMPKNIDAHMVLILNSYHNIQQYIPTPSIPSAKDTLSFFGVSSAVLNKFKRILIDYINYKFN